MDASQFPSLVSVSWLKENLSRVRVLDASWYMPNQNKDALGEFCTDRIPGSLFFDLDGVADHSTDLPHMLPSEQQFEAAADALGISNNDTVVLYDRNGIFSSPRAWWTWHALGHDKVAVLDGGMPAWKAAGGKIDSKPMERDDALVASKAAAAAQTQSDKNAEFTHPNLLLFKHTRQGFYKASEAVWSVEQFVDSQITLNPTAEIPQPDLYKAYRAFCAHNRYIAIGRKAFAPKVSQIFEVKKGVTLKKEPKHSIYIFHGIQFRRSDQDDRISQLAANLRDQKEPFSENVEAAVLALEKALELENSETLSAETPVKYKATLRNDEVRSWQQMVYNIEHKDETVVDARPGPRFRGEAPEPRPGLAMGHIPGSFNVPWDTMLHNGCMKSPEELKKVFADAGVDLSEDKPVVATCGSGTTACILVLAIKQAAPEAPPVSIYDGSWSEWGRLPDVFVATAEQGE